MQQSFRSFVSIGLSVFLSSSVAVYLSSWQPALAQTSETDGLTLPDAPSPEDSSGQGVQPVAPGDLRPLNLDSSFLSIEGGQRLIDEASDAVATEDYTAAIDKLQEARQVFNQLSNFYQQLAASFSGIDNQIADQNRTQARETAQMRDNATYQLALVHRAQSKPELAVPLLIQVIRSQAPTRDLGQKAYQQLLELGFVTDPFPRGGSAEGTSESN
ncbi:MAG: hypothetical protein ACFBSC_15285 [Microcoleaceae cyanobacterium]